MDDNIIINCCEDRMFSKKARETTPSYKTRKTEYEASAEWELPYNLICSMAIHLLDEAKAKKEDFALKAIHRHHTGKCILRRYPYLLLQPLPKPAGKRRAISGSANLP